MRTNSRSLNSPEFECAGKGDARRVVTLGDSRTMAEGVPFEALYSRRLEALLNAGPGPRHEVINAGVSGYSSHQGRVLLERELLSCRPDLVTVLFGISDQDVDQGISDREKGTPVRHRGHPTSRLGGRYEAVVREVARERGVALVDLTPEFTTLRREPLHVDDMHPSTLGHDLIARRLLEELTGSARAP